MNVCECNENEFFRDRRTIGVGHENGSLLKSCSFRTAGNIFQVSLYHPGGEPLSVAQFPRPGNW